MRTTYITLATALVIFGFSAVSCNDDEPSKPKATIHELGTDNSKTVVAGTDLHVDVEIEAPNKIASVTVKIHPEGTAEKAALVGTTTWSFDSTYTEFDGLRNAEFHKHIDVPVTAAAGDYHFHITVVDQDGYAASAEEELTVTAAIIEK
jgi:hypothetical protein